MEKAVYLFVEFTQLDFKTVVFIIFKNKHVSSDSLVNFNPKYNWNDSGHRLGFVVKFHWVYLALVLLDPLEFDNIRNILLSSCMLFILQIALYWGVKWILHANFLIMLKHSSTFTSWKTIAIMLWETMKDSLCCVAYWIRRQQRWT